MNIFKRIFLGLGCWLYLGLVAENFAATVTLKDGQKIEGTIVERTESYVQMESNGMPALYFMAQVESVEEDRPADEKSSRKKLNVSEASQREESAERIPSEVPDESAPAFQESQGYDQNLALTKFYSSMGNSDLAVQYAEMAMRENPRRASVDGVFLVAATNYYSMGQYKKSYEILTQELSINPDNEEARFYQEQLDRVLNKKSPLPREPILPTGMIGNAKSKLVGVDGRQSARSVTPAVNEGSAIISPYDPDKQEDLSQARESLMIGSGMLSFISPLGWRRLTETPKIPKENVLSGYQIMDDVTATPRSAIFISKVQLDRTGGDALAVCAQRIVSIKDDLKSASQIWGPDSDVVAGYRAVSIEVVRSSRKFHGKWYFVDFDGEVIGIYFFSSPAAYPSDYAVFESFLNSLRFSQV